MPDKSRYCWRWRQHYFLQYRILQLPRKCSALKTWSCEQSRKWRWWSQVRTPRLSRASDWSASWDFSTSTEGARWLFRISQGTDTLIIQWWLLLLHAQNDACKKVTGFTRSSWGRDRSQVERQRYWNDPGNPPLSDDVVWEAWWWTYWENRMPRLLRKSIWGVVFRIPDCWAWCIPLLVLSTCLLNYMGYAYQYWKNTAQGHTASGRQQQ